MRKQISSCGQQIARVYVYEYSIFIYLDRMTSFLSKGFIGNSSMHLPNIWVSESSFAEKTLTEVDFFVRSVSKKIDFEVVRTERNSPKEFTACEHRSRLTIADGAIDFTTLAHFIMSIIK
ncbi:MAG: hypothetical protein QM734_10300 [Cyclobacteriaceae bacterium]